MPLENAIYGEVSVTGNKNIEVISPAGGKLMCPLCKGDRFDEEEGRMDSKWGFTSHKMQILICSQYRFTMLFSEGRSFWNPD